MIIYDDFKGYIKCLALDEGMDAEDYRGVAYRLHAAIEEAIEEICKEQDIKDYEGWI